MIDYLKPLIWVLAAVLAALALHALLRLMQPAPSTAIAPGQVLPPANGPDLTALDGNGPPPVTPPTPMPAPAPTVTPVTTPTATPTALPPAAGAAGIGRVALAQWEKALTQHGFAKKAHPTLHAGDPQYQAYVFSDGGVERAWAFLQTPGGDGLVARLEFYVDGKEAVTPAEQPGVVAAGQAIIDTAKSLDQTLAEAIAPVLYSPYTGPDAFQPSPRSAYKGFARDVGHYIALRLTPRNDMPGGQFLLLWKDPAKKVGAMQNSLDFADKCAGAKWETFKAQ